MARVQLLLCFTILFASVTLLDIVSAHLKIKPALPQIEDPKTVNDVEPYTVKVVMIFVSDLEKECPKTSKFKAFFEKLRAFAKYVCPIKKKEQKDYDRDMKAKAGGLFQAIASFAVGKIKEEIRKELQEEKMEAINTFKWMKSVAGKIMGGRKNEESEDSMKLTAEQQKEIKEGILKWETVIARITNTMVLSTTNSSSGEDSTSGKGSSSDISKSSDSSSSSFNSGSPFKDTTGSSSNLGSPSGSPPSSPSGSSSYAAGGSETSFMDTTGGGLISPSGSPTHSPSTSTSGGSGTPATGGSSINSNETSKSSASGGSVGASKNNALTVTEVEAETSKEVMIFIMNLEKKCPQKEEYKSFFEKLKGTMTASAKVSSEKKKGFFSGIKSVAGKLSDAMTFIRSRIGSKSAEMKKSMETYQAEVMKAVKELETIHSQILSQNQGKKEGSLTVTVAQQTEIKQTITKWEQVTTQFVEKAIQSESSSTTSSSLGNIKIN